VSTLPVMEQEIPTQEMVDSYPHLNGVKLDVLPDHRHFVRPSVHPSVCLYLFLLFSALFLLEFLLHVFPSFLLLKVARQRRRWPDKATQLAT
jgi:hypothetical protein